MKSFLILSIKTNTGIDFWIKRPIFEINQWIELYLNIEKNEGI